MQYQVSFWFLHVGLLPMCMLHCYTHSSMHDHVSFQNMTHLLDIFMLDRFQYLSLIKDSNYSDQF